jgi:hypothetical protein
MAGLRVPRRCTFILFEGPDWAILDCGKLRPLRQCCTCLSPTVFPEVTFWCTGSLEVLIEMQTPESQSTWSGVGPGRCTPTTQGPRKVRQGTRFEKYCLQRVPPFRSASWLLATGCGLALGLKALRQLCLLSPPTQTPSPGATTAATVWRGPRSREDK